VEQLDSARRFNTAYTPYRGQDTAGASRYVDGSA